MIRSTKIISPLNTGKFKNIQQFLETYNNCVNYLIVGLWSNNDLNSRYIDYNYIESAKRRFKLTARLICCAGKQALEIVKSQHRQSKRQRKMPRYKSLSANLDYRFWKLTNNNNSFEWLRLQSGFTFYIPFKKTKIWNKWVRQGFNLSKSMRLSIKKNKLILEFYFEKELPNLKTEGSIEGLDLGYVNLAICSNRQKIGEGINQFIRKFHKHEKHTHKQIEHRTYQELKKLDLSSISILVLENLKYVKHNTREMFSRTHNRHLSHWLYAKVIKWIGMRCEEQGVQLQFKSPWKTSQFCRFCGNWDRRNRNGDRFKCIHCGHEEQADSNGAQNLKLLGLAEVYSLRSLKTSYKEL